MVEIQPLKADRYRVFLSAEEYGLLINCAPHHRAKPPMKIMALSARVGTAAEVTPSQFCEKYGEHFLRVEGKDPSDRYQETKPRKMWIPSDIYNSIQNFIENRGIGDTETICDVKKRQLQNWVGEAAENAAQRSGEEDFNKVSSHDLRRYFATHFLIRLELGDQIVSQLGGWKDPDSMYEYLLVPNDLLVHRLTKMGLVGTNPLHMSGTNPIDQLNANFATIDRILSQNNENVMEETKREVKKLVGKFDSLELTEYIEDSTSDSRESTNLSQTQSSLSSLSESDD